MKKRKIRYDRILLPILILCVIIFGISSCHKTEETKVQSKPIHTMVLRQEKGLIK